MANKDKKNVKRFAEDISKKMAEDAYNGGSGGTYTAGNGITITEENVINADVKVLVVEDIETLTNEQCNSLNAGDIVVANDMAYKVFEKGAQDLQLQITFSDTIESPYYYRQNENSDWEYQNTEVISLGGVVVINLHNYHALPEEGWIAVQEGKAKLTYDGIDLAFAENDSDVEYNYIFTSTVYNNKYLQVAFKEIEEDEEHYYQFVVETISVTGNTFIVTFDDNLVQTKTNAEILTALQSGKLVYFRYNDANETYTNQVIYGAYTGLYRFELLIQAGPDLSKNGILFADTDQQFHIYINNPK